MLNLLLGKFIKKVNKCLWFDFNWSFKNVFTHWQTKWNYLKYFQLLCTRIGQFKLCLYFLQTSCYKMFFFSSMNSTVKLCGGASSNQYIFCVKIYQNIEWRSYIWLKYTKQCWKIWNTEEKHHSYGSMNMSFEMKRPGLRFILGSGPVLYLFLKYSVASNIRLDITYL